MRLENPFDTETQRFEAPIIWEVTIHLDNGDYGRLSVAAYSQQEALEEAAGRGYTVDHPRISDEAGIPLRIATAAPGFEYGLVLSKKVRKHIKKGKVT